MKHVVGVAEMRLSRNPEDEIITHGLGSCLGITVYDSTSGVGGLLHVMMPISSANPDKASENPFMFVDTGVPEFLKGLERAGLDRGRCRLKVAGGAMMHDKDHFEIGRRNYVALRKVLWKCGLLISGEDVGGTEARSMCLNIRSGEVRLSKAGEDRRL